MQSWPIRSCGFFGADPLSKYDGHSTAAMPNVQPDARLSGANGWEFGATDTVIERGDAGVELSA